MIHSDAPVPAVSASETFAVSPLKSFKNKTDAGIVSRIALHPGKNSPTFSRIVYGTWRLADNDTNGDLASPQSILQRIKKCLDLGITTFDLADIYGCYTYEKLFGNALALEPSLRERMELVTKCDISIPCDSRPDVYVKHYDTSAEYIISSVEKSLEFIGTSYIDVLLIHRPDPLMNADEVASAFKVLRSSGKVRHFGVSNFSPSQFELLQSRLDFPLVTNQVEISVMNMDCLHNGVLDQMQRLRVAPMAWSPLGGGRLFSNETPQSSRLLAAMEKVAKELGPEVQVDQVAYIWLLTHPSNIIPVLGTNKLDRIERLAKADGMRLNRQQWFSIWEASMGREVP